MINKRSDQMVTSKYPNDFYLRAVNFLNNKQQKIKEAKEIKLKNEFPVECTFHPKLVTNYRSNRNITHLPNQNLLEEHIITMNNHITERIEENLITN